ncbi:LytTR family DNA-binding domain-containing protein [Lichenicoccus sp.]|uniref:LytTR family DNA-binding domain-containing protein n=1 Tax=Lichenicoccus sp. TaxID=2781899 RepID=UPI003D0ACB25
MPWIAARGWRDRLVVGGLAGVFLGLCGPFGSYLNGSAAIRLGYWVAALLAGTVMIGSAFAAARRLALYWRLPEHSLLVPATFFGALPLAIVCRLGASALWPQAISHIDVVTWYGQTVLVTSPFTLLYVLAWRRSSALVEPPRPAGGAPLLAGLAAADIIALQMEDHYVRVHTRTASRLVLMPMHQAIGDLGEVPGLRVHRSWWVARDAVVATTRHGRNVRLRLANGVEAPVSRANIVSLRAAGVATPGSAGRG